MGDFMKALGRLGNVMGGGEGKTGAYGHGVGVCLG